jgi:hypothetical protein
MANDNDTNNGSVLAASAADFLSQLEIEASNAKATAKASGTKKERKDDPSMAIFAATCPHGEVITHRRNVERDPLQLVIVGYETNTRQLGVFTWTSNTSKQWLKGVLLNTLRKAKEHDAQLVAEDLHIVPVELVDAEPEGALQFSRGQRHFIDVPRLSLAEQLDRVVADLGEAEAGTKRQERLEGKKARLEERIANEAKKAAAKDAPQDESSEDEIVTFRTKAIAVGVARERGLTADNVIPNDEATGKDDKWLIVAR